MRAIFAGCREVSSGNKFWIDYWLRDGDYTNRYFYIARRHTQSFERAKQAVDIALATMEVCHINCAVLETALTSGIPDFKDAVQVASAVTEGLDAIGTRDRNFYSSLIPIFSITQVLKNLLLAN